MSIGGHLVAHGRHLEAVDQPVERCVVLRAAFHQVLGFTYDGGPVLMTGPLQPPGHDLGAVMFRSFMSGKGHGGHFDDVV